jgi:ABC-type spermidine/putrescine transport system permease subunit II
MIVLIAGIISAALAFVFSVNTGVSFMFGAGVNIIPTLLYSDNNNNNNK